MDPATHLEHLHRELDLFAACLAGDLRAPVRSCGAWTLYDLANHLGQDNLWVTAAVTEQRGDHEGPPAPRAPGSLAAWFRNTSDAMLGALSSPAQSPAWTIYPPPTVGFWRRRRAQETLVHRWDAETALGRLSVMDPELAADGVAEVVDTMAPRQVTLGRIRPLGRALHLTTTDTGEDWVLGPGAPVATASGKAQDLLLTLWHRLPPHAPSIRWAGDADAGQALLATELVP